MGSGLQWGFSVLQLQLQSQANTVHLGLRVGDLAIFLFLLPGGSQYLSFIIF